LKGDIFSGFVSGGTPVFDYEWNTTPIQTTSTASNLAPGNYEVLVTDSLGCSDTSTVTIGSPSPVETTAMDNATICYGDSIDLTASAIGGTGTFVYYWSNGIELNDPARVSPVEDTSYTVYAIDGFGCVGTASEVGIDVEAMFQTDLSIVGNTFICPGTGTSLFADLDTTNTGSVTYNWTPSIGNGNGPYEIFPDQPTTYFVSITNDCGVTIKDSVNVDFKPLPTPSFYVDTMEGCEPIAISFTDQSTTPYDDVSYWYWDFGDGGTSSDQNPVYTFNQAGTYDVTLSVETNMGCISDSLAVNTLEIYPIPNAEFESENSVYSSYDMNVQFVNSSQGATIYDWSFGDGGESNEEQPSHSYPIEYTYDVTLITTSEHECLDTATIQVPIIER